MTESKQDSVSQVMTLLRGYGVKALRMPERKKKSCDIVASSGRSNYFIEVKDRIGVVKPGSYVLKYGYSSSVNKKIETAIKQFRQMPGHQSVFNILWLRVIEDDDEEFLLQGILCTLYGIERMFFSRNDHDIEVDCFYFHNSPMKKYPLLDATVIETKSGLIFCLNDNAPKLEAFRRTKLFKLHKRRNGVIDPLWLEKQNCCLIAPPEKDRQDRYQLILKKSGFRSLRLVEREKHLGIAEPFRIRTPKYCQPGGAPDRR
jgi:hypothetical protein